MSVTVVQVVAILAAGLLAGFVNTLAGGGSFITLVALEFAGLSSTMANGTNRVAVGVQNITAVLGFRSKGISNFRLSLHFAIPALIGAIIGAYVVIDLPTLLFHRILAGAMILMLFTVVFDSKKWLQNKHFELTPTRRIVAYIVFLAVGFYGGAIQAGVGFLIIASLVLIAGQDLVRTNSHKVFIIGLYTIFVIILFAAKGEINWILGIVLSIGQGAGAWVASRLPVAKADQVARWVLILMLAVLAVRYLGIIPGFS